MKELVQFPFERLPIGDVFHYNGTAYVKRCKVSAESEYAIQIFNLSTLVTR